MEMGCCLVRSQEPSMKFEKLLKSIAVKQELRSDLNHKSSICVALLNLKNYIKGYFFSLFLSETALLSHWGFYLHSHVLLIHLEIVEKQFVIFRNLRERHSSSLILHSAEKNLIHVVNYRDFLFSFFPINSVQREFLLSGATMATLQFPRLMSYFSHNKISE